MKPGTRAKLQLLAVILALGFFTATGLQAGYVADSVKGNLFVCRDNRLEPFDETALAGIEVFALYYSAHWCPPCRAFTPQLVQFYNTKKKKHPQFELIFFSSDKSQEEMLEYMQSTGMKWPAAGFRNDGPLLKYRGNGIPCLVVVDANGKVLADSFENGKYVGPEKPMTELGRILSKSKAASSSGSTDFDSFFKKKGAN